MIFPISILALAATAAAHGYVSSINAGGQEYSGFIVTTDPYATSPPDRIAWSTSATDTGYVHGVPGANVTCHNLAKPGKLSAPVAAGDTVTVTWNQWPGEHKGPVLNYLAACNGDCAEADPASLKFFKISEAGFENGVWATEILNQNGNKWDIAIPADLKAGGYVLRHEIIALHGAYQLYPQCVNLDVTGGGDSAPEGVPGAELYSGTETGLLTNIWQEVSNYKAPGPMLYDSPSDTETGAGEEPAASGTETANPPPAVISSTTITVVQTTLVTSASPPSATETATESAVDTTNDLPVVVPVTPGLSDTATSTSTVATDTRSSTRTNCSASYTSTTTPVEMETATDTGTPTSTPTESTEITTMSTAPSSEATVAFEMSMGNRRFACFEVV
ncbi:glycosyl hydrolase family 61-domain-containing protein [Aspergillus heterothallicus]